MLDRVLAFGDAWMPNHGPSDLIKRSAELRLRADRHISLQVMGVPADPAVFEAYAAEEFDRVVHWLPSAGRGPVERALDAYESAIARVHRRVTAPIRSICGLRRVKTRSRAP